MGAYFQLAQRGSTFSCELRAGLVCFLTCCYILAVNSAIIADTGERGRLSMLGSGGGGGGAERARVRREVG